MEDDTILEDGRLFMFTPIDPVFLLLPILEATVPDDGAPAKFRTPDDIFQIAATRLSINDEENVDETEQKKLRDDFTRFSELQCAKDALERVTDSQTLDDNLTVYRFSIQKTLQLLQTKVARLSTPEFAKTSRSITRSLAKDGLGPDERVPEDLRQEGRTKFACQLMSQYLPHNLSEALLASYSFASLEAHLKSLETDASLPSTLSTLSTANGKGDGTGKKGAGANGNSKKRKAETQASNGVKKLQKTDTTRMNKLTSFFAKGKKSEKDVDKGDEETDGKEDQ